MKYDLTKKLTIGASRTLISLQQGMLNLLSDRSFEEITVQALCEKAMLPRATFYNYFDDKYDLLKYCLYTLHQKVEPAGEEECQQRLNGIMENFIDFFDANIQLVQRILKHNPPNQYLINQGRFYLMSNMQMAFENSPNPHQFKVPKEMAARLYSEIVLIILEWKYLHHKACTKEEAKEYLRVMVNGVKMDSPEISHDIQKNQER